MSLYESWHCLEQHNYWVGIRRMRCPHCLAGSRPVHKSLILDRLERTGGGCVAVQQTREVAMVQTDG